MLERLLTLYLRVRHILTRPISRYTVGDVVILKDGSGYPMLITEVEKTKNKSILLYCRWYDQQTKETRHNFFTEESVAPFDWKIKEANPNNEQ
jgi:uncharacterized protein YodC (DUF2158 family)